MAAAKNTDGQQGLPTNIAGGTSTEEPADLLRELETLQRVLDDATGDNPDYANIPVLEPLSDDIPVLDELFQDDIPVLKPVSVAKPVASAASAAPQHPLAQPDQPVATTFAPDKIADAIAQARPDATADGTLEDLFGAAPDEYEDIGAPEVAHEVVPPELPPIATTKISSNPFLPQAVLDRLQTERMAAQQSAEEAHRTMQRVLDKKQQDARNTLSEIGRQLSPAQKEAMIEQLVEEMLPQIAQRLKDKLRQSLK